MHVATKECPDLRDVFLYNTFPYTDISVASAADTFENILTNGESAIMFNVSACSEDWGESVYPNYLSRTIVYCPSTVNGFQVEYFDMNTYKWNVIFCKTCKNASACGKALNCRLII